MNSEDVIHRYTLGEKRGVIAQMIAGGISFIAIIALVLSITIFTCRSRRTNNSPGAPPQFFQTHVGIYFICLILCDLIHSIGSTISFDWILHDGVRPETAACTAQAVIYQLGNVGSALWSLAIATHTFAVLFLRCHVSGMACLTTFVGVWLLIGSIVAVGPAVVQNEMQGPFHGLSGTWCWITDEYQGSKLGLEYFWLFFSAFFSFILYTLVFLRLRGNISISNGSVRFRWVERSRAWNGSAGRESVESHVQSVARQMLWYPVAYTILILPIAICRWTIFSGKHVPELATVAADCIFLLSGAVNVVLFTTTRRVIPKRPSISLPTHSQLKKMEVASYTPRRPPGLEISSFAYQDPETPTSEDGRGSDTPKGDLTSQFPEPPRRYWGSSMLSPYDSPDSISPHWNDHHPTFPPPTHPGALYFAPSSPDLQSIGSVSLSTPPLHLRPIPMVVTTPPSPSPSQRTTDTTSTALDRERLVTEARALLPTLTRF